MTAPRPFLDESRAQLQLAAPIILSQVAQVLMGLVDTVMSGRAGAVEQAVVGLGTSLWIPLFVCLMSVVQAISPLVAHHVGAGDHAAVAQDAREGVWLALALSVLPLALLPFAAELLIAFRIDPALAHKTELFLWGIGLGLPAALVYRALSFYSASIGQTRPIMVLAFVGLGVNAVFNDLLIHGRFGLPAMGGAGCGWATGIGMWVSLLGMVAWTARAPAYRATCLWRGWRRPHAAAQRQLLRLGLPMGGAALAEVAAFSSVAVLVGRFGAVQIAANQIALNFSALVFMLPMGLSSAIAIRVGHALGAGQPERASFVAWTGVKLACLIAATMILPTLLGRHAVAAGYSSDAQVRALAAELLLFAAFWQLFDATQVSAMGALRGYRITLLPMVLMGVAFWGVGIPLGIALGWFGTGGGPWQAHGFWTGLVVALVLVSIALALALRRVTEQAVAARQARLGAAPLPVRS